MEEGSLHLSKKEVTALEEELLCFWEANGTENIAMHGRQVASVIEYIIATKRVNNAENSKV